MDPPLTRRLLLITAGTGLIAGCLSSFSGEETTLPESCPITQDLNVEWPQELNEETVEQFIEEYENKYYRDVIVEYEPKSRVDSYDLGATIKEGPTPVDDGFETELEGMGGLYTPTLVLEGTRSDSPPGSETVPVHEVEDEVLRDIVVQAANERSADHHIDPGEEVDRYIELVDAHSNEFKPPSEPGDTGQAYFEVDETVVELTVTATTFHADHAWRVRYYMDKNVLWRNGNINENPEEGELLECRE